MFLVYYFICCSFISSAINPLNQNEEYSVIDSDVISLLNIILGNR